MKAQPQGTRWKATLLFALVLCSLRTAFASATGNPNEQYRFDIPPGVAALRLNDFGTQSGMQLLFNFEDMKGVSVTAVRGDYKPFDALNRMIAGTDIRYEYVSRRTVTLTRVGPGMWTGKVLGAKAETTRAGAGDRRSTGGGLEEVTVRGTQASSVAALGSSTISVSRADIDAAGFVTVQSVIRTLPQVFGGGPSEDTSLGGEASTNVGRGTGVNLRGLGAGSTLVLMNGRRLPGAGSEGQYVDVSNLPLSALERIEILPDSSSTLYGADAVGGIANFVMRDQFKGRQTEAYFGDTTRSGHLNERYISQIFGAETASGHGLLTFDFYSRGNLEAASREMAKSDLTEYGGSDFDVTLSNPGNIVMGSTIWAVPRGQDGTDLKPGDFVKDAPNFQNRYQGADILPSQQRWTGFGTWRQDLTDRSTLFGDLLAGQRDMRFAGPGASLPLIIPVTNAFYASPVPLPTPVPLLMRYNFYDDLGPQMVDARIRSTDVTAGLEHHFNDQWQVTATLGYAAEYTRSITSNVLNVAALNTALASSDPDEAFNPFGDGSHTTRETLESIRGTTRARYHSNTASASVVATGTLLELAGGDINLSFGSEVRAQQFDSSVQAAAQTTTRTDRDRSIYAGFAELTVPIVGPSNPLPGVESLAVSFAERYEHYTDFGSALRPRVGLAWAPVRGMTLLGSYSSSFRPPGLLDLDESTNAWAIAPVRDPQSGLVSNVLLWSGKNRDLHEETAHSWTAGVEIEPEAHPDTTFAVTYFNTDFTNRLSRPTFGADLLSNPTLSALITRSPSAGYRAEVCSRSPLIGASTGDCLATPIVAIADLRLRNDAIVKTRGVDMLARHEMSSSLGRFSFSLNGTYVLRFAEARAANLPLVEDINTPRSPIDFKMRGSARWRRGGVDVAAYLNFTDNYKDTTSNPRRRVPSWTTLDIQAAYTLPSKNSNRPGNTTFALGVDNLFDEDAPFLNNSAAGIGYDQENGDLIGRFVSFSVRTKW